MNSQNNEDLLLKTISERLQWDVRVNSSDILLKNDDGEITLSGYFDKSYRHAAVVEIIETTDGVKSLRDKSQVVPDYFRTDYELKALITKQIKDFHLLPGERIDVEVNAGVVTLDGVVFRPRLKAFASSDAWGLSGVLDCNNIIKIKTPGEEASKQKWFESEGASQFLGAWHYLGGVAC